MNKYDDFVKYLFLIGIICYGAFTGEKNKLIYFILFKIIFFRNTICRMKHLSIYLSNYISILWIGKIANDFVCSFSANCFLSPFISLLGVWSRFLSKYDFSFLMFTILQSGMSNGHLKFMLRSLSYNIREFITELTILSYAYKCLYNKELWALYLANNYD